MVCDYIKYKPCSKCKFICTYKFTHCNYSLQTDTCKHTVKNLYWWFWYNVFQENNSKNIFFPLLISMYTHYQFFFVMQIKCKHNVQIWKFVSFITYFLLCFVYALYLDRVPLVFTITDTFIKYSFYSLHVFTHY